jgi:hypothetical protein
MLRSMATNPADLFRQMLGEWEKLTNNVGGDFLKSDEWSRAMNAGTAAHVQAQGATRDMMAKALAAANMPSRAEFEELSARLARIENSLARIEAAVGARAEIARPKPTRGRKPPGAGELNT